MARLIKMVRHKEGYKAPYAADVHPDEVAGYVAAGWVQQNTSEQIADVSAKEIMDDLNPARAGEGVPSSIEDIIAAIGELDPDNKVHWTRDGRPSVQVLAKNIGRAVSAVDRDIAFTLYRAEA